MRSYYDDSRLWQTWVGRAFDAIAACVGFIIAAVVVICSIVTGVIWVFSGPECRAKGEKMNLQVEWAFHQGCMVNLKGQWLPWGEVVPIERGGKIEFAPKASSK